MKIRSLLFFLAGWQLLTVLDARAAVLLTRRIELRRGWNAIALDVQPTAAKPADVFGSLPVDSVACFIPKSQAEDYLRVPGDAPWKEETWAVWYAANRAEAAFSNLAEIQRFRPLLVLARADCTLTVTGAPQARTLNWQADTCTFTSLPVDPAGGPTFADFFAGSPAHQRLRVYRLESGNWKLVRQPAVERARHGEAYWIQTDGVSDYQGPMRVNLPATGELAFGLRGGRFEVQVANEGSTPAAVRIENAPADPSLPLRVARRELSRLKTSRAALPAQLDLPVVDAGAKATVVLEPDREKMPQAEGATLLRISDGRGAELWVPTSARRIALAGATP